LQLSDEALLARLVAFDTTSQRSNRELSAFLADYLDRPGVRIEARPSPDGRKENLLVELGPPTGPAREGLTLSAHMDVVPAGEGWSCDPFTLTDRGDRWLGRGSADMKGFLALAANTLRSLAGPHLARHPLAAPLALVLTYDEELGCLGAGDLADHWPADRFLPRQTWIGEPTSLAVLRLHKGHLKLRLTCHGVSAHSGYPHLGRSAIEPAARATLALGELAAELASERPPGGEHFGETPYVALNVGLFRGGTAINMIPDRAEVDLGLRLLPGMAPEPWIERVRQRIAATLGPDGWELTLLSNTPPLETPAEAPLHQHLLRERRQTETLAASYATDGGQLARLGLESVICGPGSIEVAHKPDEFLPKTELFAARALLDRVVASFTA
jgi:acetylornithine deacetylase